MSRKPGPWEGKRTRYQSPGCDQATCLSFTHITIIISLSSNICNITLLIWRELLLICGLLGARWAWLPGARNGNRERERERKSHSYAIVCEWRMLLPNGRGGGGGQGEREEEGIFPVMRGGIGCVCRVR